MAGRDKASLTMSEGNLLPSEERVLGFVEQLQQNEELDEALVNEGTAGEEQEKKQEIKRQATAALTGAATAAVEADTSENRVFNEDGDSVDLSSTNRPKTLEQRHQELLSLDPAQSRADFLSKINQLRFEDSSQAKVIKDRINQLQNRKSQIDFTPLIALFGDNSAQAAAALMSKNLFTERDKEDAIFNMKLKLANSEKAFNDNINKMVKEQEATERSLLINQIKQQQRLDDKSEKNLRLSLKDYSSDKNVKNMEGLVESAEILATKLANDSSYTTNSKGEIVLTAPAAKELLFTRAKFLAGVGPMSDQDFNRAGGTAEMRERALRFMQALDAGDEITKKDVEGFISAARTSVKVAKRRLGDRANEFVDNATSLGIKSDAARDAMGRKQRSTFGDIDSLLDQSAVKVGRIRDVTAVGPRAGDDRTALQRTAEETGTKLRETAVEAGGGFFRGLFGLGDDPEKAVSEMSPEEVRAHEEAIESGRIK